MSLHTVSAAIRAHGSEAGALLNSRKPKYHLRDGKLYLHWSASKLTEERKHAWSGTIDQARKCRRTFAAAEACKIKAIVTIPRHEEMEA